MIFRRGWDLQENWRGGGGWYLQDHSGGGDSNTDAGDNLRNRHTRFVNRTRVVFHSNISRKTDILIVITYSHNE